MKDSYEIMKESYVKSEQPAKKTDVRAAAALFAKLPPAEQEKIIDLLKSLLLKK